MSKKRGNGSKRKSSSIKRKTSDHKKENTPKYRSTVLVGEPIADITQPTRREIWLGRLKKSAKALGSMIVTVVITGMLKKYLTPDAIMRLLRKLFNAE